jgi:acyl-coenzyme A synthetase/AMP-(fatty) acid ligase
MRSMHACGPCGNVRARLQALKGSRTVDRYALMWPRRPEFVRAAARYGAAIVPFGAIGCEDGVKAVANSGTTQALSAVLAHLQGRTPPPPRSGVSARRGVSADAALADDLAMVRPCGHARTMHAVHAC